MCYVRFVVEHLSVGPSGPTFYGQTLEQHLLERQRRASGATGDFTGLFQQLFNVRIGGLVSPEGGVVFVQGHRRQQGDEDLGQEADQRSSPAAKATIAAAAVCGGWGAMRRGA